MKNSPNQVKDDNTITMRTKTFFGLSGMTFLIIFGLGAGMVYAIMNWKYFEGRSDTFEQVLEEQESDEEGIELEDTEITDKGGPQFASKKERKVVWTKGLKDKEVMPYVKRFAKTAKVEQSRYDIPASITLAQGIWESNCGQSKLATKNKNHFGIKCFERNCVKGHCSNFEDDHHKDFFRIYKSDWDSYRSHSEFLSKKRYVHLKKYGTNYEAWANGLKKAGYATDPNYAKKLIEIIERFKLYEYDR